MNRGNALRGPRMLHRGLVAVAGMCMERLRGSMRGFDRMRGVNLLVLGVCAV